MRKSRTLLTAALIVSMIFSSVPAFAGEIGAADNTGIEAAAVVSEADSFSDSTEDSSVDVSGTSERFETSETDAASSESETETSEQAAGEEGQDESQTESAAEGPAEETGEAGTEEIPGEEEILVEEIETDETNAEETQTEKTDAEEEAEAEEKVPAATYSGHQKGGKWGSSLKDGAAASASSGALDAIKISVSEMENLGISYTVKLAGKGWQSVKADGAACGNTNGKNHIEAIRVSLTGADKDKYTVYYCTSVTKRGWLGWAKNGETAGSEGYEYSVTGFAVMILPKDAEAPKAKGSTGKATYSVEATVKYSAHVQRVGWQSYASDGAMAGTSGKGLRVEAFKIKVDGSADLGIRYRSHVQNIGWQGYVSDNALSGTTGRALRVEAFQAELTGADANKYDLYYCVHVQRAGWLAWAKNGAMSGSAGYSLRMEAVKMMILPKGSSAPKNTGSYMIPYLDGNRSYVTYQTQVQRIGWQKAVTSGKIAGTSGQSLRMETIKVSLQNQPLSGSVVYSAHVQNIGWQSSVSDGAIAGTVGKGLRLEAVKLSLTGNMSKNFNIYYRVHVQNKGWTGWASNGAECGSAGFGYRLEAIQIIVQEKAAEAPGSTSNVFYNGSSVMQKMLDRAQGYSSMTGYLILVNRSTHNVLLCTGRKGNWSKKFFWECGDGAPGTPTIEGVFTTKTKVLYFGHPGEYRCWYATQFYGDYLLHSVKYDDSPSPVRVIDARLGTGVSQGCVRLATANAKWIYDNIPMGTTVVVYH